MNDDSREQSAAATIGAATAALSICVLILAIALAAGACTWHARHRRRNAASDVEGDAMTVVDALPVMAAAHAALEAREYPERPARCVSIPAVPRATPEHDASSSCSPSSSTSFAPLPIPPSELVPSIRVVRTGVAPWLATQPRVVSESLRGHSASAASRVTRRVFTKPESYPRPEPTFAANWEPQRQDTMPAAPPLN